MFMPCLPYWLDTAAMEMLEVSKTASGPGAMFFLGAASVNEIRYVTADADQIASFHGS